MSAPDPRGVAIARDCERRPYARTWRDAPDRRSQSSTLKHVNDSLIELSHDAPPELTYSMSIAATDAMRDALADVIEIRRTA